MSSRALVIGSLIILIIIFESSNSLASKTRNGRRIGRIRYNYTKPSVTFEFPGNENPSHHDLEDVLHLNITNTTKKVEDSHTMGVFNSTTHKPTTVMSETSNTARLSTVKEKRNATSVMVEHPTSTMSSKKYTNETNTTASTLKVVTERTVPKITKISETKHSLGNRTVTTESRKSTAVQSMELTTKSPLSILEESIKEMDGKFISEISMVDNVSTKKPEQAEESLNESKSYDCLLTTVELTVIRENEGSRRTERNQTDKFVLTEQTPVTQIMPCIIKSDSTIMTETTTEIGEEPTTRAEEIMTTTDAAEETSEYYNESEDSLNGYLPPYTPPPQTDKGETIMHTKYPSAFQNTIPPGDKKIKSMEGSTKDFDVSENRYPGYMNAPVTVTMPPFEESSTSNGEVEDSDEDSSSSEEYDSKEDNTDARWSYLPPLPIADVLKHNRSLPQNKRQRRGINKTQQNPWFIKFPPTFKSEFDRVKRQNYKSYAAQIHLSNNYLVRNGQRPRRQDPEGYSYAEPELEANLEPEGEALEPEPEAPALLEDNPVDVVEEEPLPAAEEENQVGPYPESVDPVDTYSIPPAQMMGQSYMKVKTPTYHFHVMLD